MTTQNIARLTEAEANELGGALLELTQLDTKSIVEKDDAAKKRALTSFVQGKFLAHATEFLAAWFTLKHEYEPYLSAQATLLGTVLQVIQRRQQIQEAAQQQQQQQQKPGDKECCGKCDCESSSPLPAVAADAAAEPTNVIQLSQK